MIQQNIKQNIAPQLC